MAKNVTGRQKRLIDTLLSGQSVTAACQQIGISRNTAYRWMRQAHFKQALQQAQNELTEQAMRRLLSLQEQAINALVATLGDPRARRTETLRAAEVILGHVLKLRSVTEFAERLEELEAAVADLRSLVPQDRQTD